MTSDDTDTPRGNDEDAEESASDEATTNPPRDPETGKFLPKDERPDAVLDSPETAATKGEQSEKEISQTAEGESEAATQERETESEPMVEEEPEPESMDESDEHESESTDKERETESEAPPAESDAEVSAAEPDSGTPTETTAADPKRAQAAGTEQATAAVFVTNPNGYPRPPSTYLPTHPWLRLPSRPPEYETISR